MPNEIYDWRGKEISLDEYLLDGNDSVKRGMFHKEYLSQIGTILGFKNTSEDFLGRIFKEYKQQHILNDTFLGYISFFNAFFIHPYGFSYSLKNGEPVFSDRLAESNNDKEKKIINFLREINLPLLFCLAIETHKEKQRTLSPYQEVLPKEKLSVVYNPGFFRRNLEGTLKAEFSSNHWDNLSSNFEDCIFIRYNREKQIVTFGDYWFASLLHAFHPDIYYLNFVVGDDKRSRKIKQRYNLPLVKAILMETNNPQTPLLVEGVLGCDLSKIEVKSGGFDDVKEFIDFSIWQYFEARFRTKNAECELLYFPFHQSIPNKAYTQFDDYIKKKYRLDVNSQESISLKVLGDEEKFARIMNHL